MPQNKFIAEQIASGTEQWKVDHAEAMACRDLEELLETGIGYFHVIRLADRNWSKQVQAGEVKFDAKHARELHASYEWWLGPCDNILDRLDKFSRNFKKVEHAEEFRDCVREAHRFASIDVEAVIAGLADVAAGDVVEFDMGNDDEGRVDA